MTDLELYAYSVAGSILVGLVSLAVRLRHDATTSKHYDKLSWGSLVVFSVAAFVPFVNIVVFGWWPFSAALDFMARLLDKWDTPIMRGKEPTVTADNDIVSIVDGKFSGRSFIHLPAGDWADIRAEIVRLRGEVAMTEQQKADRDLLLTGTSFMRDGKRIDPATVRIETPAPAMPDGVEGLAGVRDTLIVAANNPSSHGREIGLRRIMLEQASRIDAALRAADNHGAAGVDLSERLSQAEYDAEILSSMERMLRDNEFGFTGRWDEIVAQLLTRLRLTPAAVPAGEAVATEKNVHTEHCCREHGCKYGEAACPVELGQQVQSHPCEDCTPQPADGEAVAPEAVGRFVERAAQIISGAPFPSGRSLFKARQISDIALSLYTTPPAPVQAAPQEGEAMDRGPWRRKGARFYSDDFTHDVSLVVGGDFGSDEVEDRYLDWLLSVLNGPAGAALQHRGDSRGGEVGRG